MITRYISREAQDSSVKKPDVLNLTEPGRTLTSDRQPHARRAKAERIALHNTTAILIRITLNIVPLTLDNRLSIAPLCATDFHDSIGEKKHLTHFLRFLCI